MTTQTINLKLIESLIQSIDALSPAEQNVVRSRLLNTVPPETPRQSAIDILNSSPGQQIFKTPEEVDRDIQAERDSWDN